MMKLLPQNSKKGITLVESVIAVVVLAIFATGVISLLTASGAKILQTSGESAAYAEATQQLDLAISAISNGSSDYLKTTADAAGDQVLSLDTDALKTALVLDSGVTLTATIELYDDSVSATATNVRGWYLTLTYSGISVSGFASNTQGVFDLQ